MWADPSVWISYDPREDGGVYGATTFAGGREVTLTQFTLRRGHWTTAATLVHELAHVNGTDGISHDAEGTLASRLPPGLEDPTIIGMLQGVRHASRTAAA